jgi:hypothetical protein
LDREDAYYFLKELNEICQMMKVPHLSMDAIKLRYIPFALKDLAKRWLYTLTLRSITSWTSFYSTFLEKYYSTHLTIKKKKEIMLY